MKDCIDCKHAEDILCMRPFKADEQFVLLRSLQDHQRSYGRLHSWFTDACGRHARFFEPKDPQ